MDKVETISLLCNSTRVSVFLFFPETPAPEKHRHRAFSKTPAPGKHRHRAFSKAPVTAPAENLTV